MQVTLSSKKVEQTMLLKYILSFFTGFPGRTPHIIPMKKISLTMVGCLRLAGQGTTAGPQNPQLPTNYYGHGATPPQEVELVVH